VGFHQDKMAHEEEGIMQDEMDILKEIGGIASGHGSIALSEILKRKINLSVPKTEVLSGATIKGKIALEQMGIAVFSKIVTGMNGKVIFLLDEKNAFKLNDISYKLKADDKRAGVLTELGMSLIKEIGSMVTSAYVSALGIMFKRVILLAPPTLISGTINEILNITIFKSEANPKNSVLLVEAVFDEPKGNIKGSFYLVLTPEAAEDIIKICKDMLKNLDD